MSTSIRACFTAVLSLVLMQPAFAALPPQYQNAEDLDVMVEYVKQHSAVAAAIKSIDMQNFVIHFGAACTVQFARAATQYSGPGPAEPLEFKSANCPVD